MEMEMESETEEKWEEGREGLREEESERKRG